MKTFCKTFSLLLLIPFLAETVSASHVSGAGITYAAVPGFPNQYVVTVKAYRDCFGIPPANNISVDYISPSGCGSPGFVPLTLVPGTGLGNEIQTGFYPPCLTSNCAGGFGYGIEEWVYSGLLVLPNACNDWVLSFDDCCRSSAVSTGPSGAALYVETTLNNLSFSNDNSPVFNHYGVHTVCIGRTFQLDMSATDPDGDSLVYTLVDAWEAVGSPVPYDTAYSGTYPIASLPAGSLNAQTGIFTVNPTTVQVGVFAILVESYDYTTGQLNSTVRRDGIINVEVLCNEPPRFDSVHVFLNNANATCNDSVLHMKLTWAFRCSTLANDGSDFRLLRPDGIPILLSSATAHNCNPLGMSDSISIVLTQPVSLNGVYKIYSKIGYDGNTLLNQCGLAVPEYDTCYFSFNNCPVGLNEFSSPSSILQVYPNPADKFLTIKTSINGNKRFRIMNAAGQQVAAFESDDSESTIDLSALPGGNYYLEMTSEKDSDRVFFVIN